MSGFLILAVAAMQLPPLAVMETARRPAWVCVRWCLPCPRQASR